MDVNVQREQYGFPLVLAKRSISSSNCGSWDQQTYKNQAPFIAGLFTPTNPDAQHEIFDNGYVIILNCVIDLALWSIISYLLLLAYEKKKNAR